MAAEKANPFDVVTHALKTARSSIEHAEIELERIRNINRILLEQVQTMRASFEAIQETVGGASSHFQTMAKQNVPEDHRPPTFLTERRDDNGRNHRE